jgi:hypothetical protein
MSTVLKKCRAGRTHDDGVLLVEYLMAKGGKVQRTNEAIAAELRMEKSLGGGMRRIDMSRFVQARNHVKDGTDAAGRPCTGYRLHYRSSVKGTEFALIDPTGDLGPHLVVAIESLRGWMGVEQRHKTENRRGAEEWIRLGEHAYARADAQGYRVCTRMSLELERDGTVSDTSMAEAAVWLDSLRAKAKP